MNSTKRRLLSGGTALAVFSLGLITPANASVYKTCYVGMPSKISVDYSDPFSSNVAWSKVTFSGDCPSNEIPTSPIDGMYYTTGTTDVNYTAAQLAFLPNFEHLRWAYKGSEALVASVQLLNIGQDADGNDTYAPYVAFNGCVSFLCGSISGDDVFTPMISKVEDVFTGNPSDLTETADYKFIPANSIATKMKTKLTVSTKRIKGTQYLKLTINLDRGMDILGAGNFVFPGDKITIKRGKRVIARVTPSASGKVTVRIRDISGKNKYKVSVPETVYSWSKSKSFTR